jgi:hypothetical protein
MKIFATNVNADRRMKEAYVAAACVFAILAAPPARSQPVAGRCAPFGKIYAMIGEAELLIPYHNPQGAFVRCLDHPLDLSSLSVADIILPGLTLRNKAEALNGDNEHIRIIKLTILPANRDRQQNIQVDKGECAHYNADAKFTKHDLICISMTPRNFPAVYSRLYYSFIPFNENQMASDRVQFSCEEALPGFELASFCYLTFIMGPDLQADVTFARPSRPTIANVLAGAKEIVKQTKLFIASSTVTPDNKK